MKDFARVVLIFSAVALVACAAVAAAWWVMAAGERDPDIPASVWFFAAVGCLSSAGFCAWCVAILDCADRVTELHRMIDKELRDRSAR